MPLRVDDDHGRAGRGRAEHGRLDGLEQRRPTAPRRRPEHRVLAVLAVQRDREATRTARRYELAVRAHRPSFLPEGSLRAAAEAYRADADDDEASADDDPEEEREADGA